jgi:methylenetetrahydrofolate dehydrogenase (NADP+) / methenyltetrahydrofolate cyclohydrolase
MTARILTAKPLVERTKKNLILKCESFKAKGITPSMAVVLVGDNPASLTYIKNKKKLCEEVGARFELHQLSDEVTEKEFLDLMERLNTDSEIHGIIIQLPVSEKIKKLDVTNLVSPLKDIDGFHSDNTQKLYRGSTDLEALLPCTPKGIVELLTFYQVPIESAQVTVVGRSLIVGKPLALLLSNMCATVTMAHAKTKNLKDLTRNSDIVIVAIGKGHFLDESYFDKNKKTVVIDVGMNTLDGKLVGDVDSARVENTVAALSPVPGGVGPMTVVSLIENLMRATEMGLKDIK